MLCSALFTPLIFDLYNTYLDFALVTYITCETEFNRSNYNGYFRARAGQIVPETAFFSQYDRLRYSRSAGASASCGVRSSLARHILLFYTLIPGIHYTMAAARLMRAVWSTKTSRVLTKLPVPSPSANEVLIRNVAVASNPKDWKYPM